MSTAWERFDIYWSGGDPGIRSRFLLRTTTPMVISVTAYVLFVTLIGPMIMRNRRPVQIRPFMIAYNFGLVLFYLYFLLRGYFFIPELGFSFICGDLNSYDNPIIPDIFDLAYKLYVVRYVELLDTVYLVLSKKFNMVTPLHVFHHAIVPVVWWFGLRAETSGYLAVFMAINAFVHIIMYSYYAVAALGSKYQKYLWWKKYLTTLQILQFFFIVIYMNFMYLIGCTTSKITFAFSSTLCTLFFILFVNYYRRAYVGKEKTPVSVQVNGVQKPAELPDANGNMKLLVRNGVPSSYRKASKGE